MHDDGLAYARATAEIEAGLASIDFAEVTREDRVTFVEHAVVWQVRCALRAGLFDVALAVIRYGVARIAEIERSEPRYRLRLVRGAPADS